MCLIYQVLAPSLTGFIWIIPGHLRNMFPYSSKGFMLTLKLPFVKFAGLEIGNIILQRL